MSTGYTAAVKDGEITEFSEYARSCARAFGANILMRDDPADAPIREYEPSTFYRDCLEEAKRDLAKAEKMTLEEAARQQAAENKQNARDLEESNANRARTLFESLR